MREWPAGMAQVDSWPPCTATYGILKQDAAMEDASARPRLLVAALVLLGSAFAALQARALQPAARPASDSPPSTPDTFNKYCVTCHNARLKTAGLELDSLDLSDVAGNAARLYRLVPKLRTRAMPPPGPPPPPPATPTPPPQ